MTTVVLLPGDGIGPEVVAGAVAVLRAALGGDAPDLVERAIGGAAIDAEGTPLPAATVEACARADAVLLGAVGGPRWDARADGLRPEQGLLGIRKALGLWANLRPVRVDRAAAAGSPLRAELLDGVDILFVRELTGGIYFGAKHRDAESASDVCAYTVGEIERVVRKACELARGRRGRVASVDKANVLETSRLWRETATRIAAEEFPDVELEHLLVDAMAMHLLSRPRDFDVVVTENMFGDILTDEASMLAGSLGMLPSASLGSGASGLYEPVHGSAPDIAGHGVANPIGAILSVALMLRYSLDQSDAAVAVEDAVATALERGVRPHDLDPAGGVPTETVVAAVISALERGAGRSLASS